eukprot:16442890-Heterocapsa_arctica.AAC.1
MNAKDIDLAVVFRTFGSEELQHVTAAWGTSKVRVNDKLTALALRLQYVKNLLTVQRATTSAIEKFKKMLAQQLWEVGASGDVKAFNMTHLKGVIIGFASASEQPAPAAPAAFALGA